MELLGLTFYKDDCYYSVESEFEERRSRGKKNGGSTLANRGPHMNTVPWVSPYLTRAFFRGEVGVVYSFTTPSQSAHSGLLALKAVVSSLS